MKQALIITTDRFPNGDAGAIRQATFAGQLVKMGYAVDIIGFGPYTGKVYHILRKGIRYISLRRKNDSLFSRVCGRLFFTTKVRGILLKSDKYDVIMIASVPYGVIKLIKRYSRKSGNVLVHDSVEWYSSSQFSLGKFSPPYIIKNLNNVSWIDKDFRVIAISEFLHKYFSQRGIICCRIPFVLDTATTNHVKTKKTDNIVRFIYAGNPGNKDLLDGFLCAVAALPESKRERIVLDLYGFQKEFLIKCVRISPEIVNTLGDSLQVHGRVSHVEIEAALQDADFSILFRRSKERYAQAGFPTKVTEGLAHSTPIFCNLSSDLKLYLEDGVNGVISKSESSEDILEALDRIMELSNEQLDTLKKNARRSAEERLSIEAYQIELKSILS